MDIDELLDDVLVTWSLRGDVALPELLDVLLCLMAWYEPDDLPLELTYIIVTEQPDEHGPRAFHT